MKLRKVVSAYFYDLAEAIESEKISDKCISGLLKVIMDIENLKESKPEDSTESKEDKSITEKAAEDIKKNREEMSPEECLACELANMLGIGKLTEPGEFPMSGKPTIKIKIKKVSSKEDLNKILKELKEGGNVDLNTMNNSLGEIFDLNSILEIMETPMFKLGGNISSNKENNSETLDIELLNFLNE